MSMKNLQRYRKRLKSEHQLVTEMIDQRQKSKHSYKRETDNTKTLYLYIRICLL